MFILATDGNEVQRQLMQHLTDKLHRDGQPFETYMFRSKGVDTWWDKPRLLLDACKEHGKVVWLDNDIEIVDDKFYSILDLPAPSAAIDNGALRNKWAGYNAGLLIVDQPYVERWQAQMDYTKRSDQDSLPVPEHELPRRYNYMATDPIPLDEEPLAIHWAGYYKLEYHLHLKQQDGRDWRTMKADAERKYAAIKHTTEFRAQTRIKGKPGDWALRLEKLWK